MNNNIERKIKKDGVAIAVTEGNSMEPMLKSGDIVIVEKPSFPLKLFDVPVYRRGDRLTMHRIVKCKNRKYVICGDNRINLERDITEDDIVGVLSGFYKNNRYINLSDKAYVEYCRSLNKKYFVRVWKDVLLRVKLKVRYLLRGDCKNEVK